LLRTGEAGLGVNWACGALNDLFSNSFYFILSMISWKVFFLHVLQ